MKRLYLMVLTALTVLTATARNVWSGSQAVGWDDAFVLSAQELGTVSAGDCFVFTFEVTDPDNWPQFRIEDLSYKVLGSASLSSGMTTAKIYATQGLVDGIASGARIRGTGCTMTAIDLIEGDGGDYSHAVWLGETAIGSWSGFQIEASAFAQAAEGQLLRFKFKDLGAGATLSPRNPEGWTQLPDAENVSIAGTKHDYTITANMLAVLQSKGLVVGGVNFTATAVELWNADELKPLTLSVPVTDNWVYTAAPSFTVSVTNPYSEPLTAHAVVDVATDKMAAVGRLSKSVEVAAGATETIVVSMEDAPAAGFYHATVTVNDDLARAFYFGVSPTSIVSAPDKQSDFDAYWAAAKEQLAAVEAADEPVLTEITSKSTANRKVYLVEMKSVADGTTGDAVTVRGYYCEPTDGQKHPVIMHYLGYDSGYRPGGESATPYCPGGDDNKEYAEFYLSTRGQSINNRPAADRADGIDRNFTNTYDDWFAFNFGQKDSYYYRGAYMDCVRAIDFMATRQTSDMQNLFAEGQSQGGAFTIAAAALSGRTFKAIAPGIPFMGDFPDYFELSSWPAYVARNCQQAIIDAGGTMSDADMYAFLSYFDTKNLAAAISCPYITSIGLQDNVCPPHTNIAPYNNLLTPAADRQIVFNAELGHQVNSSWNTTYTTFFKNYETAGSSEDAVTIWEGSQPTDDWTGYVNLGWNDRGSLSQAMMTDVVRVTFTTAAEGAQIQLSNPNDSWAKFDDEAFQNVAYSTAAQTFEYTIAKASVLEDIQMAGIIVTGKHITVSKVELVKTAGRYDAASVTIGAEGLATYSSTKKLDFSGTAITPYYASAVAQGTVTMTGTTSTWEYQGYMLKGAAGTYDIPVTDAAEYPTTNYLRATADWSATVYRSAYSDYAGTDGDADNIKSKYRYVFANQGGNTGFYKLTKDHTLAAHKAYLETPADIQPASGASPVMIVFEGAETTGLQLLRTSLPAVEGCYTLAGQRVAQPRKGLYIVNGKKLMVK